MMRCPSATRVERTNGFTLVEMLVVLVLASALLAALGRASATLLSAAETAAKHTELVERLTHFLRFTSDLASASTRASTHEADLLCVTPSTQTTVGVLVIAGALPACLSLPARRPDTPVLVIDTLTACEELCEDIDYPAYLWLAPGCHPLFAMSHPQMIFAWHSRELTSCAAPTTVSHWQRYVLYLRDYAWQPQDGMGALMLKKLNGEGVYGRAEMLVANVLGWQFSDRPYRLHIIMHANSGGNVSHEAVISELPVSVQPLAQSLLPSTVGDMLRGASVTLVYRDLPVPGQAINESDANGDFL